MFGKYFKRLRQEKDLTLIELSEKCGVSKSYLHDIENEKIGPPQNHDRLQVPR